jgi:hypothetical protein
MCTLSCRLHVFFAARVVCLCALVTLVQWHCKLRQACCSCSHMHEHVGSCTLEQTSHHVCVACRLLEYCQPCRFVCALRVCVRSWCVPLLFSQGAHALVETAGDGPTRVALHDTFHRIAFKRGRSVGSLQVLFSLRCTTAQLAVLPDVQYLHPHVRLTRFDRHFQ